ncbi:UNVERIFIED_CONTAM: hypothetical protein H355_003990 [Colinus virginianus]|nr:hypothetical protein H355_003990 [Colinus virginianus]
MALPVSLPVSLPELGAVLAATAVLLLLAVCVIAHVTAVKMPALHRHAEEKYFLSAEGRKEPVPSIHDPPSKELSVVVPSYNEEDRLPLMMDEALDYLEKRQKRDPSFTYEVIVVNDGSKDQTTEVAMRYCEKYGSDKVRVLSLVKNRGKGGAVRMGVLSSRGKKILMADADGATKFADIEKVEEGLKNLQPWPNQMAISCGSRAHLEKDSIAKRSYFRTLLMYGFHFLVWFLCVQKIRDTQCGFKLLTREAALRTFSTLHVERWAFDVELLYIAQHLRIPIAEVAVNWTEIEEQFPTLVEAFFAASPLVKQRQQRIHPSAEKNGWLCCGAGVNGEIYRGDRCKNNTFRLHTGSSTIQPPRETSEQTNDPDFKWKLGVYLQWKGKLTHAKLYNIKVCNEFSIIKGFKIFTSSRRIALIIAIDYEAKILEILSMYGGQGFTLLLNVNLYMLFLFIQANLQQENCSDY